MSETPLAAVGHAASGRIDAPHRIRVFHMHVWIMKDPRPQVSRAVYAWSGPEVRVRSCSQCPSETKSTSPSTTVIAV